MTLREMIERFRDRIDDPFYWNQDRARSLANTMKDKLAQEMKVIVPSYYEFDSVQGQEYYQVPTKYVSNHLLYYNSSYNREIRLKANMRDIIVSYPDSDTEGFPEIGVIWTYSGRRQLKVYPTFNEDGIEVKWWFWGWPSDMSGDADEPEFPVEWHPSLVEGMINQAKVDDGEMNVGDALLIWQHEVKKVRAYESTVELIARGGRYGTFEGMVPAVEEGGSDGLPFIIASASGSGVIW